ncbi:MULTISPECIES: RNB domain-containing ribonuclease [unclassified Herbaspirillum]|uniref:ribonuclease catalytic domain-containing protein n=1 Tax=unclassified Herbaspirillum TaxID=2624150 RepID=UPI000E2F3E56|nr:MULTISPECIES: RNB domain-containing ribonuclease [unclassified Herbaspirillum]RFB67208.1 RNB domain-containing ribonuclease [Herbaspirillum sp. 3R-3a1]TFI06250.1 RNB domain-containing ribonuclease [Herbaspirillum sp. 3R11]TFI14138.1 RNB domain-containing ribonuclease [Herbaspirillum sp. 3R-11]TFI27916.1 RNB domain-containing ribonuclease [Herbaspirillum sp. 3C11]
MNLFFEESGDFKAGAVLSQQGEAYQVEMASGKRTKVKSKDVMLQFASPAPAQLLEDAQVILQDIDLDFLWEVAGEDEFGFAELGTEYFGHAPLPHEAAGLLLRLHSAPIYFYKKGKGRYKAAPLASLQAAQAGLEKKKQQALVQAQYVDELKAGKLPDAFKPLALTLLFRPDKNSIEFKALDAACKELQTTPQRLMLQTGGLASPKDLHYAKFLFEFFPKGSGFPEVTIPTVPKDLPLADVQAFSIDDVTTTEIDDALSVVRLADGSVRVGIHIAAPGLGIKRDDALDAIARHRMSTVYMPGEKITMLPDSLVEAFTLDEGKNCPALSLYATLNPADWSVISTETRAEIVPISANLRHNDLDALVTEEALANNSGEYPHKDDITLLWQWVQVLEQGRMAKRESFGLRPEQNNRVDFNFYVDNDVVTITRRKRGAPLDKIVAELMIFANSTWGKFMADHGVPGIYRAQGGGSGGGGGWAAKMQVRMVTHAAPHQGLGVDQYAWSTSPLRRYTDLVNQWQILACLEHGVTAPLAAPFKPRDADLFAIVSGFDSAYSGYADFQSGMERYWCLRWLAQEEARQVDAVVLKDEILRLVDIPLVIRLPGMPQVARGLQVKLDLLRWDEVDLTVEARLLDIPTAQPAADAEQMDEEEEALLDGMENAADGAEEPVAEGADEAEPAAGDQTAGTPSAAE